jgi:hypothetical protein
MVYCTYIQFGILKRAVLSPAQYERYQKDPSIVNLQCFATQRSMEESYAREKGKPFDKKTILYG